MIKHIVLWTFKNTSCESEKIRNILQTEEKLRLLRQKIPFIKSLETGRNINLGSESYDLALITEFESLSDLEKYQNHPEHLALVSWLRKVRDKRAVIDYEI